MSQLEQIFKKGALTVLFVGAAIVAQAGKEPILRNTMGGSVSLQPDSFRIVEDVVYTNNDLGDYLLYKAESYVSLEVNQDQISDCFLDSFSFSATLEVTGWDENGSTTIETITLDIRYSQLLGEEYKAIATKKYEGFYKLKIEIVSVSSSALTPFVRVSGEIAIERYRTLDVSSTPDITSSSYNSTTGNITVSWAALVGAEEYDLEFTFIDDYLTASTYLATSALTPLFKRNATRVTIRGTSYSFSNIFEHGYVVFRVRPVGRSGDNFTHIIYGKWSNNAYSAALSSYASSDYLAVTALNATLNWQYVNTFAEEGKRKELISFMDGTFRSRQSITRISSDTTLVVGESIYDYQGRPAMQIIPIPIDESKIDYQADFSIHNSSGDNYDRIHFDTGWCLPIPGPLSESYGAGKYYSGNNEFLSISNHWLAEHNKYIPDANGYVFTRTIFTPDNSGRVAVQSGIGLTHTIGSGHETRYYYGSPFQEEIDRLFGNNVGNALHYQKQMVVDPNGQVSVSYTDLSGKVIATALSGTTPSEVQQLSNNTGKTELEVNLIDNTISSTDPYSTVAAKSINVAVPAQYRLSYLIEIGEFDDNCLTDCYECVYDLAISVQDECGVEMLDGDLNTSGIQPFVRQIKRSTGEGFSLSCSLGPVEYKFADDELVDNDSLRVTLGVGSYTITKVLSVSNEAAEYYADQYLATETCVKTQEDFNQYFEAIVDDFGCDVTCETCTELLSDSAAYVASRRTAYINLGYEDNSELWLLAAEEYHSKRLMCDQICGEGVSPCDYQKQILEVDVSEQGQYAYLNGDITQHPEYCHYDFCQDNQIAYRFDTYMNELEKGNEAIQAGWMDPLQTQSLFPNGEIDSFFMDGANSTHKTTLINKLNDVARWPDNSPITLWQLAINSAFCSETTNKTEGLACIGAFSYDPNATKSRNTYMFNVFRAGYLKARKEVLDEIKYGSGGLCETIDIPEGKAKRFPSNADIINSFPDTDVPVDLGAEQLLRCTNFCDSTSYSWLEMLGPCVLDHPQKEQIREALVVVCQRGCDANNPMGASSASTSVGGITNSFQDVLDSFGIYNVNTCNSASIISVREHSDDPVASPGDFGSNWDCKCESFEDTSLVRISDPALRTMLGQITYMEEDSVCETCITCEQLFQNYYTFYQEYGSVPFDGDSSITIWPSIFSNYLNQRLSFTLTFDDYRAFIEKCLGQENSDDDFEDILSQYRTAFTWLIDQDLSRSYEGSPTPANYYEDRLWRFPLNFADVALDGSTGIEGLFNAAVVSPGFWQSPSPCWYLAVEGWHQEILDDTTLTDADTNNITVWQAKMGPFAVDTILVINTTKEMGRQAFAMNYPDLPISSSTNPDYWNNGTQLVYDYTELGWKHRSKFNANDLPISEIDTCVRGSVSQPDSIYNPGDEGVPSIGGKITCQDIRDGLEAVMDSLSWTKFTPTYANYWRLAGHIDTLNADTPHYRMGWWQDSAYRMERIISEVSQCILEDDCYRELYFDSCSVNYCTFSNENNWKMKLFLDEMVETDVSGFGNLLAAKEWEHEAEGFVSFNSSDLYTGSEFSSLKNIDELDTQINYSGQPRTILITDGDGYDVELTVAFRGISMQHIYSDLVDVLSFKPVYFSPCDTNTKRFNFLAVLKTVENGQDSYDTLWMFGQTDSFNYLSNCQEQLVLCNQREIQVQPHPCGIDVTTISASRSIKAYEIYVDSIRSAFIHAYKLQCIAGTFGNESFKMRFDQQEYHYTLYYYDLAGNLIQTVPPEGVNFLTPTQIGQSMGFRNGIGTAYFASHDLPTKYKYNTLNELTWQSTPDGGSSNFWYDRLGRLVVSQNEKQGGYATDRYSYTEYDALGRIVEVGQIAQSTAMTFSIAYDVTLLNNWIVAGAQEEITNTYYDDVEFSFSYDGFTQNYLRNRVASTTYTTTEGATDYQSAVHYDYDVHGNVKAMVRETPGLDSIFEQYKVIRYEYELVSGNVIQVSYQQDSIDRFFHKYEYDGDNRVVGAYTSRDQIHWDRDAKYTYYLHGPMARTELGELRVQGMDYAYTLHGWLKGVNSERLRTGHDIGKDGNTGSTNQWVCADEFGFGLGYFDDDYSRIGSVTQSTNFLIGQSSSMLQDTGKELFNGNISTMVTSISKFMEQGDVPFGRAFQYDQLNRIVASRAFNNVDTSGNTWKSTGAPLTHYATNYTYDANGNILSLVRKGKQSQPNMDELSYHYFTGTNRLEYVDDAVSSSNYGIDIDDQSSANYGYDAIGNLTSDASEEIETITWTVYGKIQSITRTSTSTKPDLEFEYSPDGYRSAKHVTDPTTGLVTSTWYVRDASGNIMATYEKRDFTTLDTTTISIAELNNLVITDWGDHVFAKFLNEAVELHTMMDGSQFTALKLDMTGAMELETMLKMNSPLQILVNETTLADNTVSSYTSADFFDAMNSYYGSANTFANTVLMNGCGNELISYLAGNYYTTNDFVKTLFTNNVTEATAVWDYFNPLTSYPGASIAASTLQSNVSPVQDLYDQIGIEFSAVDVVTEFENIISTATLETALQSFGSLKTCTRTVLGDNDMFTILDVYDRNILWDEMISNSTLSDLADMMINYEPGLFMQSAVELNTNRAIDLFSNLPVTYHITDYLNAILNYVPFGSSYYNNIVNQLIGLGHAAGNWEYSAGEHHIYGSSRVGVHQTNLLTRARYNQGDISITLEDVEFTSLYRGKRHYELNNHLGNVQVVVSDKRVSVCDEELEVDYFKADVLSAMDYYPFGMMMPDRQWYAGSDSSIAVNGFNGMRKDDEINGVGNSLDFGARIYDARLGRWLSLDPAMKNYPGFSPYSFVYNSPLVFIDPDGKNPISIGFAITAIFESGVIRQIIVTAAEVTIFAMAAYDVHYVLSKAKYDNGKGDNPGAYNKRVEDAQQALEAEFAAAMDRLIEEHFDPNNLTPKGDGKGTFFLAGVITTSTLALIDEVKPLIEQTLRAQEKTILENEKKMDKLMETFSPEDLAMFNKLSLETHNLKIEAQKQRDMLEILEQMKKETLAKGDLETQHNRQSDNTDIKLEPAVYVDSDENK